MSINVDVDGKFKKNCGRRGLLCDPERTRKELEEERRRLRLQQVREESKNLAQQIRKDVAEEKERQLRNLGAIRTKELECWRQYVLNHRTQDYRTAIFQVGMAHNAANKEAAQRVSGGGNPSKGCCSYKEFQKQTKARTPCKETTKPTHCSRTSLPSSRTCQPAKVCPQTNFDQCQDHNNMSCSKREAERNTCCCAHAENVNKNKTAECKSTSSTTSTSSNFSDCTSIPKRAKNVIVLSKTPAVVVDVEVDSDDSVTITPFEVKDKHVQNNRQFHRYKEKSSTRTSRSDSSPASSVGRKKKKSPTRTSSDTSPTSSVGRKKKKSPTRTSSDTSPTSSAASTPRKTTSKKQKNPSKKGAKTSSDKPRFTRISELVNKTTAYSKEQQKSAKSPIKKKLVQKCDINECKNTNNTAAKPQKVVNAPKRNIASTSSYYAEQALAASKKADGKLTKKPSIKRDVSKSPQKSNLNTIPKGPPPTPISNGSKSQERSSSMDRIRRLQPTASQTSRGRSASPKAIALPFETACACEIHPTSLQPTASGGSCATMCLSGPTIRDTALPLSTCSGRVQYYDYNNKFSKDYPQPADAVHAETQTSFSRSAQRDAMEEAYIERQLRESREQQIEELRKRSDERGQKAIEREQVRRDCIQLTEKLDTLSRQHPQLIPNNANCPPAYRSREAAARREKEMNSAVEELLSRPAVITCPEVVHEAKQRDVCTLTLGSQDTGLNLGASSSNNRGKGDSTSDSCCSVLLGYVDDQRKKVRSDLDACKTNPQQNELKSERLRELLNRIEQLRISLLQELQTGNNARDANYVDSVKDLRRERENILDEQETATGSEEHVPKSKGKMKSKAPENPTVSEENMRELFNLVRQSMSGQVADAATNKEFAGAIRTASGKPVEIIIKVQGQRCTAVAGAGGHKRRIQKKAVKAPQFVKVPKETVSEVKLQEKPQKPTSADDSTSTSYRSLPQKMTNQVELLTQLLPANAGGAGEREAANIKRDLLTQLLPASTEDVGARETANIKRGLLTQLLPTSTEDVGEAANIRREQLQQLAKAVCDPDNLQKQAGGRINPLLALYVQRLLGMTRSSINALGISSSDVETPSTTIVEVTGNVTSLSSSNSATGALTEERLQSVERFIQENRSFVDELKQVLCTQKDMDILERSVQAFEDMWRTRLLREQQRKAKEKETGAIPKATRDHQRDYERSTAAESVPKPKLKDKVFCRGLSCFVRPSKTHPGKSSAQDDTESKEVPYGVPVSSSTRQKSKRSHERTRPAHMEELTIETQNANQQNENQITYRPNSRKEPALPAALANINRSIPVSNSKVSSTSDKLQANATYYDIVVNADNAAILQQQAKDPAYQPRRSLRGNNISPVKAAIIDQPSYASEKDKHLETEPTHKTKSPLERAKQKTPQKSTSPSKSPEKQTAIGAVSPKDTATYLPPSQQKNNFRGAAISPVVRSENANLPSAADERIDRYERLTTNCTQRIAELTDLINRVRGEKVRLLEGTLSSVSGADGRDSTEYAELPDRNQHQVNSAAKSAPTSPSKSKTLDDGHTQPLEKDKHIGKSHDSGIAMSYPLNAQGHDAGDTSQADSTTSHRQQQPHKVKPPPTISRYSPQLQLPEDELMHQLSTILEVDSPVATGRTPSKAKDKSNRAQPGMASTPQKLPTFDEYMQQMHLDRTQINPEQSMRIEEEFNELVAALAAARDNDALNYVEFPSITTYLQNLPDEERRQLTKNSTTDSIEDLLACLRIANLSIKSGRRNRTDTENTSESLLKSSNDTDTTLNIEAELRKRYLGSRPAQTGNGQTNTAGTRAPEHAQFIINEARNQSVLAKCSETSACKCSAVVDSYVKRSCDRALALQGQRVCSKRMVSESGVERLSSTSPDSLTADLERDLCDMGMKWATTMRQREREKQGSSSREVDSSDSKRATATQKNKKLLFNNVQSAGRPLSLRDFLTQELMKHASTTCSSTSPNTDDSMRSQFLFSVIDSISPSCSPHEDVTLSKGTTPSSSTPATGRSNNRQKTSTPVNSRTSPTRDPFGQTTSSSGNTHLFSGESHLSSVHQQQSSTTTSSTPEHHVPQEQLPSHAKTDEKALDAESVDSNSPKDQHG